jgi:hypothetical protein
MKGETDGPLIKAEIDDKGALVLVLFVPVMGIHVDFNFIFLVGRESIDILETQLRDAEEEIERLKREIQKLKEIRSNEFIVLRAANVNRLAARQHAVVSWNNLVHNSSPRVFQVSANYQQVLILSDGFYQVSCRLTNPGSSGNRNMSVRVNGIEVANSYNGVDTGYTGSVSICDIIPFKANDNLTVYVYSDHDSFTETQSSNHFKVGLNIAVPFKNNFLVLDWFFGFLRIEFENE